LRRLGRVSDREVAVVLCFRLEIHIVSQFFTGYDGLDFETAHVKPSMDPSIWSITTWILEHWSVNGIYIYIIIYIYKYRCI
jgi:hypothetical protein